MSHQLQTYILTYQVWIPAHSEDEAIECAYEMLDTTFPDNVEIDLEASPVQCTEDDCLTEVEDE